MMQKQRKRAGMSQKRRWTPLANLIRASRTFAMKIGEIEGPGRYCGARSSLISCEGVRKVVSGLGFVRFQDRWE
jgi:hypothetical protein